VLNQDCTATLFGTLSNSKTHASLNRKLGIVLQDFATYNTDDIAAGLQDFLICVEMFLAALAHAYCFPPRDYADPTHPRTGFLKSIKIMFDVRDVVDDVQYAVDDTVDTPPPPLQLHSKLSSCQQQCNMSLDYNAHPLSP